MSQNKEALLASIFNLEGENEINLDVLRYNLTQMPGFSLSLAFRLIDVNNDGYITGNSLQKYLAHIGVIWTYDDAKSLVNEYDYEPKDGKLTQKEFSDLILPFYYESTKHSPERNKSKQIVSEQANEVEKKSAISFQLSRLIETAYLSVMQRHKLIDSKLKDENVMDLFEILDQKIKGYLEIADLEFLLQRHGYIFVQNTGQELLEAIMRGIDRNRDGKISFSEFQRLFKEEQIIISSSRNTKRSNEQTVRTPRSNQTPKSKIEQSQTLSAQQKQLQIDSNYISQGSQQSQGDDDRNIQKLIAKESVRSQQKPQNALSSKSKKSQKSNKKQIKELENTIEESNGLKKKLNFKKPLSQQEQQELMSLRSKKSEQQQFPELLELEEQEEKEREQQMLEVLSSRQSQRSEKKDLHKLQEVQNTKQDNNQQEKEKPLSPRHYSPLRRKNVKQVDLPNSVREQQEGEDDDREADRDLAENINPIQSPFFGQDSPSKLNQKSPERLRAEQEDQDLFGSFSQTYHDKNFKQRVLVNFLTRSLAAESELENLREEMAMETQFNIYETFKFFDQLGRGFIYVQDMERGFKELGIQGITSEDIYLFFRRFDVNKDGMIMFSEFCHAVGPITEEHINYMMERKPAKLQGEFKEFMFTYKAKKVILPVLAKIFEVERKLLEIRKEFRAIKDQYSIATKTLFSLIDTENQEFVNGSQIMEFLEKNEVFVSVKEIKLIFKILDRDRDGTLDYQEFLRSVEL